MHFGLAPLLLYLLSMPPSGAGHDLPAARLQVSAGGLVSALMGVGNFQTKWIGWPGVYIEAGPERDELTAALHSEGYSPVYLDQKTCDLHYNGFCNSVLWQLFHYVPLNIGACGWGWG